MSTDAPTIESAIAASSQNSGDERLAHRGVFQRLFIRPEIGALLGVAGIWTFFWAVSGSFGTANGLAGQLDTAATLGIMAVAVSMLMIGGEFDLSSGANTGAMGMLLILMVKDTTHTGGAGLSLWIALPASLLVALGIGWLNGFLVERTKLPSFIVTLATFFILIGAKLGFAKLIVQQIQVGRTSEGQGYDQLVNIFAYEWNRTAHQFELRDTIYSIGVIGGLALVAIAVYELHFARADETKTAGLIEHLAGIVGILGGIFILHATDSVSANWLAGSVIAVGGLLATHGLGTWRYERLADRGSVMYDASYGWPLFAGLFAVGLAALIAVVMDSDDKTSLVFPFTHQGLRAALFITIGGFGLMSMMVAGYRARQLSMMSRTLVLVLVSAVIAGVGFLTRYESQAVKFRAEAFTVILITSLLVLLWAISGTLFSQRKVGDAAAERRGILILGPALALIVVGMVVKLMFTTDAEIARGIASAKFSMRIVWFVGFTVVMSWILGRTRFGSWTLAVGGNKEAARQVGVPAARTKTQLFMIVAGAAWLVGVLLAFRLETIQANTGNGLEFEYIIAAVVGGTLLTGGYGTVIGGAIGALIMSMAELGIPSSRWESDWRFLFLGVILLLAVVGNQYIRNKAEALR